MNAMSIQAHRTSCRRSGRTALTELLGDAFALAYGWRDRSRQRRALMRLDDRLLHDVGLNRSDVEREGLKPFWQG